MYLSLAVDWTSLHGTTAMVGVLVLIAGAALAGRGGGSGTRLAGLVGLLAVGILAVTGTLLWSGGQRPAGPVLSVFHVLLGLGALGHVIMAVRTQRGRSTRRTLAVAGILALAALLIGRLG